MKTGSESNQRDFSKWNCVENQLSYLTPRIKCIGHSIKNRKSSIHKLKYKLEKFLEKLRNILQ